MISSISAYMPAFGKPVINSPQKILDRVSMIAKPAIALVAFSMIPGAVGGFGPFTVCMGICLAATAGFGVAACAAACVASLAVPLP